MSNVVVADQSAVGPAKWIKIEAAAKEVLECIEEMPNGQWRVHPGQVDRYHLALKMMHRLIHDRPLRLEWLLTNGGAPMFAYHQPFVNMMGPTPIMFTAKADRFSILNEGGEVFVLRVNDEEIARKRTDKGAIAELQQIAEGYVSLHRASSGDRRS